MAGCAYNEGVGGGVGTCSTPQIPEPWRAGYRLTIPGSSDVEPGPNNSCAGTWSACTSTCDRTWSESVAQSGSGAACPAATACAPGEDDCPLCDNGQQLNAQGTACVECPEGTAGQRGTCTSCGGELQPNAETN